jgi:hypothetical protein
MAKAAALINDDFMFTINVSSLGSLMCIYSEHIPISWFLLQSLRARTEQSLVRNQQEDVDSTRYAIKQVLSFTLADQVGPNRANNSSILNSSP